MEAIDTSQSVFSGHDTDPQDTEGNKQHAVKGLPSTTLKDGTRKSKLLLEGTTTYPKDSEGHIQPVDIGFLSTSDECIRKSQPLPEGKPTDAKYPKGNIQPAGRWINVGLKLGLLQEILPEPTSNKLYNSIMQAGNPVKEILLKLNLPDHRSCKDAYGGMYKGSVLSKASDGNSFSP
ncbi:hypothetical protein Tco_0322129 [Tanacetum coccineum]